ncbi:glutamate receptor 3.6-like isoform X2 [Gossypium australe]|uniref:Glutamate receptor 3.6-like isoform X2 n=1 Tax=Gossypium australe TaxID=47621 RepID=A0A5B6UHS9_9ROSI|nr:glutamate receptor 3.6-like isoform X2 [Gossypium australe]
MEKLATILKNQSRLCLCSGIRDGDDQKDTEDDSCLMSCNTASDAHHIQLKFNHSPGNVTPIDLYDDYQNYVAVKNLTSHRLPILCTVTSYETAFSTEINAFTRRAKANVLCALPAIDKASTGNESSTSYMSRHMYKIAREIASLIGSYLWLKPGTTVYEESDRISDLDIVTFNLNSRNPTPNTGGIIQMAATLSFSTSKPVHYYTEISIAVPVRSIPMQFLNISQDEKNHNEAQITGFWIDLFKEAIAVMPINTTYKLVPFYGSDDQLFKALARRTFDAAIGLTVMTRKGSELIEFSYPYFEVGPVLVMKEKPELNQVFSFMMPFTNEMWCTLAAMTVFNAFVIWLVESRTGHESVGAIFWFPLATLFYGGHRESPRRNLTYFVLAPWLVLILVVSSTYTQSFTSMITTSSDTESSSCLDIEDLKKTNAIVGCDMEDSIMLQNLVEYIGFQRKNIKHIPQSSIDDYAKALSTGKIKAAFFWAPYSGLFLAKYCKGFRSWGPNRNLRGSSLIFPRGSPFAPVLSEAMLRLCGSGKFKRMKDDLLSFPECSSSTIDVTMKRGIGPGPFSGLFILSGTASAVALLITVIRRMRRRWERLVQGMLMGRGLWALKALFLYISSLDLIDGRAKVNVLCALPAKDKTTMGNDSSTSYMSRQMYEIASLIDNYLWLKPGTSVYEESDRISSDLDTVTFNLNSRNPTSKTTGIIQMAATLSFSTSKPLHYYTELSIAVS